MTLNNHLQFVSWTRKFGATMALVSLGEPIVMELKTVLTGQMSQLDAVRQIENNKHNNFHFDFIKFAIHNTK